jgi:hypothetical protein
MNSQDVFKMDSMQTQPRLGFQEIVPGPIASDLTGDHDPDIPQFDLNQHSMTELRKQVATRRKGPGRRRSDAWGQTDPYEVSLPDRAYGLAPLLSIESHPVIVQLVQRDIRMLCRGVSVFD